MIGFLPSTAGRWLRIIVGIVLLIGGFYWGPVGYIACVLGVFLISVGAADVCVLAPLFGRKSMNGRDLRN